MTLMETETETETETATALADALCPPAQPQPRPHTRDGYTIRQAAERSGLSQHTLRWYERIGLMPYANRSHTGQRRFTDRDLDWLDLVGKLRLTGMPVATMVRYAELVRMGSQTFGERRELLEETRAEVRRRIAELQESLAVLDYKIDVYSSRPEPTRKEA